ncbi:zinc ribbon domain-containing protein [uncultured Methanobrevibacter sp.]|uniref:zinc ribbon domain-containing protein n=1 Tax=uncultured Methanobrevibacter sp. TaxID=253161 RepID=UPI00261BDB46|nr:zinc ribbon domain-containing protein [uncultured Methanobrevibacter sp.]
MVKCPRCGYENNDISMYCENCTYPIKNPQSAGSTNKGNNGWNISTGKKIAIVLGIVVIALLLFSFIYNASQPDDKSSLNVISAKEKVQEGSNYPYQVHVMYNGTWDGKIGDLNYPNDVSGHGDDLYDLNCAPWDKVGIVINKVDGSTNELKVELLRDGKVVAENSTTNATGSVIINYN